jgi:hypothetical protein
MNVRLTCCVPFCKRTRALAPFVVMLEGKDVNFAEVWICDKHWTPLPLERRRAYSTARRHLKKSETVENADSLQKIFEENRELAIEIAAGI